MPNIYDRRQSIIQGVTVSMIRADGDLHAVRGSTGEAAYLIDGTHWEGIWTGAATLAGDVFRWVTDNLAAGASIDEIDNAIIDDPAKYHCAMG